MSSLVLNINGSVQDKASHAVLPLTRHQCSIHCESNRVVHGASKWRWTPQTTRDTPQGAQSEYNETFLV